MLRAVIELGIRQILFKFSYKNRFCARSVFKYELNNGILYLELCERSMKRCHHQDDIAQSISDRTIIHVYVRYE